MKTFVLILLALNLSGCATYDWSFNKFHERAQLALDEVRHIRGRVEQGQLP